MTTSTPQPGDALGTPEPDEPAPVDAPDSARADAEPDVGSTAAVDRRSEASGADGGTDWSDLIWRVGFPVAMALLILAIPILLLTGRAVVLGSTDGALVERVTDPSAPGWEALASPTPTMLLLQTDGARLVSATVLSLTGPEAGAVVLVPTHTVAPGGDRTIAEVHADGPDAVRAAVESVLGAGVGEVVTLDGNSWADVVRPVVPVAVVNPDDVYGAATAGGRAPLLFAKGELALGADQVAAFLGGRSAGESDLNRLVRHDAFWESWIGAVRTSGRPDAVAGEQESGLGRFVRDLAEGRLEVETLPVRKVAASGDGDAERFDPVTASVRDLVARVVPFPVGAPPGARPRVKLLDGVGTFDHGLVAAAPLVGAGAELVQIGNASAFGVGTTRLVYADDERRAEVEALAEALGGGEIVKEADLGGGMDVVITLGQDWAPQLPPTTAPGSVPPTTGAVGG